MKKLFTPFAGFCALCLLLLFFACTGCTTAKKATDYMKTHPEVAAKYCAEAFPVKDSVGEPEIRYIKADNPDYSHTIDSMKQVLDSVNTEWTKVVDGATEEVQLVFRREILRQQQELKRLQGIINDLKNRYKPCVPDTVEIEKPVFRENTAKVKAMEYQVYELQVAVKKLEADVAAAKEGRSEWRRWCLITWAICGIYIVLRIKKLLPV